MRHSATACFSFGHCLGVALVALVALACASPALRAQEIYKSVDGQGHVVYSDRGANKSSPTTSVHVQEPDPAEVARLAKEQQLLKAADLQRSQRQAAEDKTRAATRRNQKASCENARSRYYHLRDSRRLYKRDADGNRVYYSDEQLDGMREEARQAMTSACGP